MAAGPGAVGHRRRRHTADPRQRRACGGSGWALRDGVVRRLECATARRCHRCRDPRGGCRHADCGDDPAAIAARLDLTAACFAVAAAGSALLRRERGHVAEDDAPQLTPRVEVADAQDGAVRRSPDDESLLHRLPERARARLLAAGEPVTLAAGEWLFEAGAPADALYVVRGGRLDVIVGDTVVRELRPDEVVGELAVLAAASRSAGVRARRDSRLLRIDAYQFRSALEDDAEAQRAVTTALAA